MDPNASSSSVPYVAERMPTQADVEPERDAGAPMQAQQVEHLSPLDWQRIKSHIKMLGPGFGDVRTPEQYYTYLGVPDPAAPCNSPGWWGTGPNFWDTMMNLWMQYSLRYQFTGELQWAMFTVPHPFSRDNARLPLADTEWCSYPCVVQIGSDVWVWIVCLNQLVFNSRGWWVHVSRVRIIRSSL